MQGKIRFDTYILIEYWGNETAAWLLIDSCLIRQTPAQSCAALRCDATNWTRLTRPACEPPVVARVLFAMADHPRVASQPPMAVVASSSASVPPIPTPNNHPWSISRILGPPEHHSSTSSAEPPTKRRRTVPCADGCTWCRKKKVSFLPSRHIHTMVYLTNRGPPSPPR